MGGFDQGQAESMNTGGPTITSETMGAPTGITARRPGGSEVQGHFSEPYLMPPYHGRNGSNERTVPAIVNTPLGGMMPGPNAIAPAVAVNDGWTHPVSNAEHGWDAGIADGYPEGCPVPVV